MAQLALLDAPSHPDVIDLLKLFDPQPRLGVAPLCQFVQVHTDINSMSSNNDSQQTVEQGQSASAPTLCAAGCGFFANPACNSLCSKCYRDSQAKQEQSIAVDKATAAIAAGAATPLQASVVPAVASEPAAPSLLEQAPVPQQQEPSTSTAEAALLEQQAAAEQAVERPVQKNTSRCFCCNKKIGLTGFRCRCDYVFCGSHRMPEAHSCTFDFKQAGRDILSKNLPEVKASRITQL